MDNKYKVKVLMLKGEKGYKGDVGPQGPKGDKGDPLTFDNLTDSQKQELMTNLSTYMKKEEGSLTVTAGTTMIQTNITTYTDWSMLFVFANGVALSKDEYEIQLTNDKYNIVLKTSPKEHMTIDYVCYNLIEFAKEDYDKLPKGPKGDKGDKGDTGPQGPAGNIENLEVGGRNLLVGTNNGNNNWYCESSTGIIGSSSKIFDDLGNVNGVRFDLSNKKAGWAFAMYNDENVKKILSRSIGKKFSISFDIKSDASGITNVELADKSGTNVMISFGEFNFIPNEWAHIELTGIVTNANISSQCVYIGFSQLLGIAKYVEIANIKLERGEVATDWTPAPEDIENEVTTVNTKVENKLSNCDKLLDTNYSTTGTITFTEEKTYNFYTFIIRGDENNGVTVTIPKYVMDHDITPFVVDAIDLVNTGYSVKTQGNINNKSINVRGVTLTGWTQVRLIVYGVY